jgi:predicted hydrocarbon binding protein
METDEKSGYYYANKFSLIMIEALEEIMGKNGLNAILNLANLPELIDNYPPDNLAKEFDFADVSAINQALEEMYGPRGGRGLALRAGRATFDDALRNFGALAGAGDLAFKVLPLQAKLRIGLPAMARIFSQVSDQHSTVDENDDNFIYTIHRCPICWNRSGLDKPVCFIAVGLLQEALKWVSGGSEFRVNESKCVAVGDEVCEFVIQKTPIG